MGGAQGSRLPLGRHLPFLLAAALGVIGLASSLVLPWGIAGVVAVNLFFAAYLLLTLPALPKMDADWLATNADASDAPVWLIFVLSFAAAAVSVAALFVAINARGATDPLELAIALSAVPLGWLMVHTLCAVHYAHEYWRGGTTGTAAGGLDFAGSDKPSGPDFAYFAFTIGMTAQTSDVAVSTPAMRRLVLLHSVASFFFNTVLVAAAVNLAVSLGSG